MSRSAFRGKYFFLSNFYPCKINYNNFIYKSSEAAYQAQKFINKEIFTSMTAKESKKYSSNNKLTNKNFEENRYKYMEEILYCKFNQNPELKIKLVETGSKELIEYNDWGDKYWGVDIDTNIGENNLGKLLMKIRNNLGKEK